MTPAPDVLAALDGHARRLATRLDTVHVCDWRVLLEYLAPQSVDMVLTDMPYGTTACEWDTRPDLDLWWQLVKRVIKPRAAIVCTASQPFTSMLVMSNLKWFRYTWAWNKGNATGHLDANKKPLRAIEDVAVFYQHQTTYNPQMKRRERPQFVSVGRPRTLQDNGKHVYGEHRKAGDLRRLSEERYPTNYLYFAIGNKEFIYHPTEKPIGLFEYLIRTYTRPGDLVLDPFIGSGTTAVAARNLGRHYIGGDISPEYVDIARKRLALPYTPDMFETLADPTPTRENVQLALFETRAAR